MGTRCDKLTNSGEDKLIEILLSKKIPVIFKVLSSKFSNQSTNKYLPRLFNIKKKQSIKITEKCVIENFRVSIFHLKHNIMRY